MPYQVEVKSSAANEIRGIERGTQKRILAKIESLKTNPRPHGVKKLQGHDDFYRVRVGDYRIIYRIYDNKLLITIVKVGDRKDVYD